MDIPVEEREDWLRRFRELLAGEDLAGLLLPRKPPLFEWFHREFRVLWWRRNGGAFDRFPLPGAGSGGDGRDRIDLQKQAEKIWRVWLNSCRPIPGPRPAGV